MTESNVGFRQYIITDKAFYMRALLLILPVAVIV